MQPPKLFPPDPRVSGAAGKVLPRIPATIKAMENSLQVTRATIDYQSGTVSLHLTNGEPFTVSYENLDHDQLDPIIGFLDHLHLIANHHNPYPPNYLPLRLPASGTVKELRVGDPSYLVLEEANHLYRIETTNLQGTDTASKINPQTNSHTGKPPNRPRRAPMQHQPYRKNRSYRNRHQHNRRQRYRLHSPHQPTNQPPPRVIHGTVHSLCET